MRTLNYPIFLCACLLLYVNEATALCVGLKFVAAPAVVNFAGGSGGYNVYDPERHLQTVNFRVEAEAIGVTCEYFVALSSGQSGNFNSRKLSQTGSVLNYNAYTDAGRTVFKAPPNAASGEVLVGRFQVAPALTQTNSHSFYWAIDPQQIVPAWQTPYGDANLTLNLYAGTPLGNPTLEASAVVTFNAVVDSSVDLSLVKSGAPFNLNDTAQVIDFGALSSGAQRAIALIVRSNNGYSVSMESLNRQVMVHAQAPTVGDVIAYQVILSGSGVNLSSGVPVQVIHGTGTTPASGVSFPIEFVVGNLSGAETAGTYSDFISVTVTAN